MNRRTLPAEIGVLILWGFLLYAATTAMLMLFDSSLSPLFERQHWKVHKAHYSVTLSPNPKWPPPYWLDGSWWNPGYGDIDPLDRWYTGSHSYSTRDLMGRKISLLK